MEASHNTGGSIAWPFSLFLRSVPEGQPVASPFTASRRGQPQQAHRTSAVAEGASLEERMPLVINVDSSSSSNISTIAGSTDGQPHGSQPRLPGPLSHEAPPLSTDGSRDATVQLQPTAGTSGSGSSATSAAAAAMAAALSGSGPVSRALLQQLSRRHSTGTTPGNSSSTDGNGPSSSGSDGGSTVAALQQGAAVADGGETAAAAAERHRLANPATIDLPALAAWLEQMLPFLCMLAVIFLWYYWLSVLVSFWLMAALAKANQAIRSQVAQKKELALAELCASLLYIVTNAAGVLFLTAGARLWRSFVLLPPTRHLTVWQTLFLVFICDCLIRLVGLAAKLLLVAAHQAPRSSPAAAWWRLGASPPSAAAAPPAAPAAAAAAPGAPAAAAAAAGGAGAAGAVPSTSKAHFRQARALTFFEHALAMYRALVPMPIWYAYLLGATHSSLVCSLLIGVYLTYKGLALLRTGRLLVKAGRLVMSLGPLYGTYVDKQELVEGGDVCPICQDSIVTPIRLDCNTSHVFCEDCISEWLERDQSCPMCRAKPAGPGLPIYSDGGTTLLPQLF